jgi:Tfp pilus assembly protein FimT
MYMTNKGMSAVELVIVIAVLVLIVVVSVGSLNKFRTERVLVNATQDVISVLNDARIKTTSSKNSSVYGVHIESARVVGFMGSAFSEPNSNNKEIKVDAPAIISAWSINGGGANVVFDRISGDTANYGTVTISLSSDSSRTKIINISKTGVVSLN